MRGFETTPPDLRALLPQRISQLGLKLEGSPVERFVKKLYREVERKGRMHLRHEAGHAFNYAFKLYETAEWRELFGPFNRPYRERYRPVPFDRNFVRHIEGWYAQKHPDEDFAETFAVWLTPRSRWRARYRGWPAMRKP